MKESEIWKRCLLALGKFSGIRIFRNNVGSGWTGQSIKMSAGQVYYADGGEIVIKNPRRFHAGLIKGSGDGIGWRQVTITEDMVGKTIAQFVSMETKTKTGRVSAEQKNWFEQVNKIGGLAVIVRSPEQAVEEIAEK